MKTNLSPSKARTARAALAAACVATIVAASGAAAQDAAETGLLLKGPAAAPLAAGRAPMQMTISMTPGGAAPAMAANPAASAAPLRGPNCSGVVRDGMTVEVAAGKSVLVPLDEPVRNRTIGNPAVAQATLVSPRTLYVLGLAVGTTNMIVQGRSGACRIIDVAVGADAGGLQASLRQLLPGERDIHVATAADSIVLTGSVSSAQAAQQVLALAKAYGERAAGQPDAPGADGASHGKVLDLLSVTAPQQVMLEVRVAEVSKTLINQMGASLNIQGGFGSWSGALVSSLLAGVSSGLAISKANNKPFNASIDAQNTEQPVKILAEPRLVTISGQEATFLAGGKIFIPVPQSSGTGTTTITLQEEEFGVGLRFTPTVLAGNRISLKVAPEVSELSPTGVTLSATNVSGVSILPLITTRRASTTVQMADGETFAIGGLIKDNISGTLKALPGLGEVPVLGALFRSTSFQQDRTELVFIITPHLVHPLRTDDVPLPTDSFAHPSEADVYATGNMEGRVAQPAAAPEAKPQAPGASAPVPAPAAAPLGNTPVAPAPRKPSGMAADAPTPAAMPVATPHPVAALAAAPAPAPAAAAAPAPAPAPRIAAATPARQVAAADTPATKAVPPAHAGEDTATRIARIEAAAARIAAGSHDVTPQ